MGYNPHRLGINERQGQIKCGLNLMATSILKNFDIGRDLSHGRDSVGLGCWLDVSSGYL